MFDQLIMKFCTGSPTCGPLDYQLVMLMLTAVIGSAAVGLIGFQRMRVIKQSTFS